MRKIISLFTLALFVAGLVAAVPKPAAAQDEDPPGRVARLNYIQGSVSYQVSGDQDWVQADPNRPLTTGDSLWADRNSRGEVHIGSTAIRLSSETGISFLTLDDRTVQIQLAQGTIEVHVRNVESGDAFEIDTPNLAFTIDRGGEYRIQTDPNGDSTVIVVREGAGEVTGGGDSWDLRDGRMYTFEGRTSFPTKLPALPATTISKTGASRAINVKTVPPRPDTSPAMWTATTTSTNTATGTPIPTTAPCGCREELMPDGRPIKRATGSL